MNSSTLKTLFLWIAIFLMFIFLWKTFQGNQGRTTELNFSEFAQLVDEGAIEEITIRGRKIEGKFSPNQGRNDSVDGFTVHLPFEPDNEYIREIQGKGIGVNSKEERESPLAAILLTYAPILLIVGLWIFFMRQMQTGGNKALSFGKSKAKLLNTSGKKVTFKDVAGVEEAKEELSEVVEFLKEPQKFQKLGGRIPKGLLLMGPPGTGKTLLARAIAGEANVPFFSISGSDFVEMFVGVGASRVRDLFEQGKKNAPCIIFIDEIDAVGRHRGAGLGGGHDEREQTLNQLLVEMDGFETNEGVILIAATNRPDVLDPALLRPGRFDRRVVVDRPDILGRLGILRVHTRETPLSEDVNLEIIARGTPGFAGADLANLVNEAALIAARRNKESIDMEDFEFAKDKVMMGVERKTMMLTEDEKIVTAFHEAGHAVVAAFAEGADPLHKVTIIPRGRALGLTMQLPTEDKYTYKKGYVEAQLAILMGGRVAEEITQKDITTGAGNDIERATDMARRMVCEWGMSNLGPLSFGNKEEPVFLGREFAQRHDYSTDTAIRIDKEVERIVNESYERATKILTQYRTVLDKVTEELLEHETLDGAEVYRMIHEITGEDRQPEVPELQYRVETAKNDAKTPDGIEPREEVDPQATSSSESDSSEGDPPEGGSPEAGDTSSSATAESGDSSDAGEAAEAEQEKVEVAAAKRSG